MDWRNRPAPHRDSPTQLGFCRVGRLRLPMRVLACLALAALLLSGCSSAKGGDGKPAGVVSSSSSSTGPSIVVPTSDTLHLLAAPTMAPVLPEGSTEAQSPVTTGGFGGGGGGMGGQAGVNWTYAVNQSANVSKGEIHIWVKITDTLVQAVNPFSMTQCTWVLRLDLGADNSRAPVDCIAEPAGPINPGTKELVFNFIATDPFQLEAQETITARLTRNAFSPNAGNSVFVLSGSADHDSRLVLTGLKEPAVAPK